MEKTMNKLTIGLLFMLTACDPYKVTMLDNQAVVASCTDSADCSMDNYDESDVYDISDEDGYRTYLIQSCVDNYQDGLRVAKEQGCGSEYKLYQECSLANQPNECDYDDDEMDDFEEDYEEYANEKCWKAIQKYSECTEI
jgi:hypothetical protein